jgi:DNA-binding NarL/FixJ family response regulator
MAAEAEADASLATLHEVHLTSVYRKLGISSRSQLTAALREATPA